MVTLVYPVCAVHLGCAGDVVHVVKVVLEPVRDGLAVFVLDVGQTVPVVVRVNGGYAVGAAVLRGLGEGCVIVIPDVAARRREGAHRVGVGIRVDRAVLMIVV